MSNRPPLNWSSVLRDLNGDRVVRPAVREDRLSVSGITAWRARSSRRYIFAINNLADFSPDELLGSLAVFISRDANGVRTLVFGISDPDRFQAAAAMAAAILHGCVEVHTNRLADADEHDFILRDLNVAAMEVA